MRGNLRRATASMENPNVVAPRHPSTAAQNQAPSEMLPATPVTPKVCPKVRPQSTATNIPEIVAISGVLVSSRAKKAGDSTFTRTCAGRPSASIDSACAVAAVSAAVNAPCWNSTRMIGSLSSDQAEGRRQDEPGSEFERAGFGVHQCLVIAALDGAGQFRHQDSSHGDADHAERQFDQTIGEIKP